MLLGLAGGYCAGKSTAAELLEARGWTCVDADALGHEALRLPEVVDAVVARFGPGVRGPDGRLDRRALAAIVFSDPTALADQEAIVHPVAIRLVDEAVAAAEAAAEAAGRRALVCVNAALLHRAGGLASRCDAILEVRAPLWLRLLRGVRRDRSGLPAALRRVYRQRGFRRALREAASGRPIIRIDNLRGRDSLEAEIDSALRGLLGRDEDLRERIPRTKLRRRS